MSDSGKVVFEATILEVATGIMVVCPDEYDSESLKGCEDLPKYLWIEGNYACDCNRHIFFSRMMEVDPDPERKCGDGGYLVCLRDPQGHVLFDEITEQEFES